MTEIPDAEVKQTTYENFIASCPSCQFVNVFNRASDLKDLSRIPHRQVNCRNCSQPFILSGDSINPSYQMLIYDCYELIRAKHYMYCVLNLAQAYEVFFSQYLRAELLYWPYVSDSNQDNAQLNRLADLLYGKVKKHPFTAMRNLFFYQVLQQRQLSSLIKAEVSIKALPKKPSEPPDKDIESVADQKLSGLLMRLKYSKVADLRNQVVHQRAYRPKLEEVNNALKETREILIPLAKLLKVYGDDLNWYKKKYHQSRSSKR